VEAVVPLLTLPHTSQGNRCVCVCMCMSARVDLLSNTEKCKSTCVVTSRVCWGVRASVGWCAPAGTTCLPPAASAAAAASAGSAASVSRPCAVAASACRLLALLASRHELKRFVATQALPGECVYRRYPVTGTVADTQWSLLVARQTGDVYARYMN
jgi:hypothetical protein